MIGPEQFIRKFEELIAHDEAVMQHRYEGSIYYFGRYRDCPQLLLVREEVPGMEKVTLSIWLLPESPLNWTTEQLLFNRYALEQYGVGWVQATGITSGVGYVLGEFSDPVPPLSNDLALRVQYLKLKSLLVSFLASLVEEYSKDRLWKAVEEQYRLVEVPIDTEAPPLKLKLLRVNGHRSLTVVDGQKFSLVEPEHEVIHDLERGLSMAKAQELGYRAANVLALLQDVGGIVSLVSVSADGLTFDLVLAARDADTVHLKVARIIAAQYGRSSFNLEVLS